MIQLIKLHVWLEDNNSNFQTSTNKLEMAIKNLYELNRAANIVHIITNMFLSQ